MRLLAASDIHIGRIPSLPDGGTGVTGRSAWEAVVQCALDRRVDALLLAGDVVEQDNAWFEAYGALLKGLRRLAAAGVAVLAVAGNHDAEVLPRVAAEAPELVLLGREGWEARDLGPIRVAGWSFPGRVWRDNPLATFPGPALTAGRPWIGLLHCDLDATPGTPYAPVPGADLRAAGAGLWILGHVHRGGPQAGGAALYCGSPFALDAGEEGGHGAWLLEVEAGGRIPEPAWVPLCPWRFRTLDVDLDQTARLDEVQDRVAAAFREAAREASGTVYGSLVLRGACALSGTLEARLREGLADLRLDLDAGSVLPSGRIQDATVPLPDLPALAQGRGARAALARLLLQLDAPEAAPGAFPGLLERVRDLEPDLEPGAARDLLAQAARRLLAAADAQGRGE